MSDTFLIMVVLACAAQPFYMESSVEYIIRAGKASDHCQLKELYVKVASISGGLVRAVDEITDQYVDEVLHVALERGLIFIAEAHNTIIGALLIYTYEARAFSHVLTETTALVDPAFQRCGIGTSLLTALLHEVKGKRPDILRVEINTRESNPAVRLYERLGFVREFEAKNRIRTASGTLESDIYMVWLNPNFRQ